ncbi:glyoxalase [Tupanvirus deep ocean]|uniref:Glyoxalase n=2 Tax=Tupanvirus TaxID=2094720 RepID=A0AC62A8S7_9VIRU|nr:glyoxalase [Tupanvirus deep ocean]QKU34068.1 glyoxalase [Tupanvirus deep ocean]
MESMKEKQVEQYIQNHITPYLIVKNAIDAINFYHNLFGAKELFRLEHNGKIHHAELQIKESIIMLADENLEWGMRASDNPLHNSVSLGLHVDNVDKTVELAQQLGAKVESPPKTEYYGLRMASIIDPYGIRWGISTRVQNVSNDETKRIHKEMMNQMEQQTGGSDYYQKYLKYKLKYLELKDQLH